MNLFEYLAQHGIECNDPSLIERAFIHPSYAHEHKQLISEDNQRLEFVGDAVLQLWTANHLYHLTPKMDEGKMTKLRAQLVCEKSLAYLAKRFELNRFLKLGIGEKQDGGQIRDSIVADLFESFIGALYLDGQDEAINRFLSKAYENIAFFKELNDVIDYKTKLQEYIQADDKRSIQYVLISMEGPANKRVFEMAVQIDGITYGKGIGNSKKRAEQEAAREALAKLAR